MRTTETGSKGAQGAPGFGGAPLRLAERKARNPALRAGKFPLRARRSVFSPPLRFALLRVGGGRRGFRNPAGGSGADRRSAGYRWRRARGARSRRRPRPRRSGRRSGFSHSSGAVRFDRSRRGAGGTWFRSRARHQEAAARSDHRRRRGSGVSHPAGHEPVAQGIGLECRHPSLWFLDSSRAVHTGHRNSRSPATVQRSL